MGMHDFIDELSTSQWNYSENLLIQLKEHASALHKVLNQIYSTRKSDVSRRTYQSLSNYKALQLRKPFFPDEFYHFRKDDVSISIVTTKKLYFVKSYGFAPDVNSIKTVISSRVFDKLTLFDDFDPHFKKDVVDELKANIRPDCVIYGGLPYSGFDDIVLVYSTLVQMYLDSSNV